MADSKKEPSNPRSEPIEVEFGGIDDVLQSAGAWTGLRAEVERALDVGPPIATLYHDDMADAHWAYLTALGERCKAIAADLGVDVERRFCIDDEEFTWGFDIEHYDVIESRYRANAVALTSEGLFLPHWHAPMAVGAGAFAMPGWLVKLLSLFGVEAEDLQVVGEVFSEEIGDDLLREIRDLLSDGAEDAFEGKWDAAEKKLAEAVKKLGRFLEKLVDRVDDFAEKLFRKWFERIGPRRARRKAAKIGAKISAKVVPGLGWFLFLLELLWLLMKNFGIVFI